MLKSQLSVLLFVVMNDSFCGSVGLCATGQFPGQQSVCETQLTLKCSALGDVIMDLKAFLGKTCLTLALIGCLCWLV